MRNVQKCVCLAASNAQRCILMGNVTQSPLAAAAWFHFNMNMFVYQRASTTEVTENETNTQANLHSLAEEPLHKPSALSLGPLEPENLGKYGAQANYLCLLQARCTIKCSKSLLTERTPDGTHTAVPQTTLCCKMCWVRHFPSPT